MASEYIRYRADLLGTQVVTRDGAKRLGIVSQIWVDIDRKEVVALGLRENMLSGVLSNAMQIMPLSEIRQIGDVILVDDDLILEDPIAVEVYNTLINCEVITENGEPLGRVRGYKFDIATGELQTLIIASVGYPQIPDQVVSTYELPVDQVVSSGPDRLIVFEGAEDKMVQLTVGILERLGISAPPWERDDMGDYMMPTPPANQLGTGLKTPAPPMREAPPIRMEREREYAEPIPRWEPQPEPMQRRQQMEPPPPSYTEPEPIYAAEPEYYSPQNEGSNWDDEESNWDDEPAPSPSSYQDVTEDVWGEPKTPESTPSDRPPVNLERRRVVEYEEETDY